MPEGRLITDENGDVRQYIEYTFLEDFIKTRNLNWKLAKDILDDFYADGIAYGVEPSNTGSGVLEISSGVIYQNLLNAHTSKTYKERGQIDTPISIDFSGESDGTYYVYANLTPHIAEEDALQDVLLPADDLKHRYCDYYNVNITYSTSDSETGIKICFVEVISGLIAIDTRFRDNIFDEVGQNLSEWLSFDDIPDGSYGKLEKEFVDAMNNYAHQVGDVLMENSGGFGWGKIDNGNISDNLKKLLIMKDGDKISFNPNWGDVLSVWQYRTQNDTTEGKFLYSDRDMSITTPIWESPVIPYRLNESLMFRLRGDFTDNAGEDIRCNMIAVDKYGDIIPSISQSQSVTIQSGWYDYNFGFDGIMYLNDSSVRGVKITFDKTSGTQWAGINTFKMPQIWRKSKQEQEYHFVVRNNNNPSKWKIVENTDNKLSSITYQISSERLELNFMSDFMDDNKFEVSVSCSAYGGSSHWTGRIFNHSNLKLVYCKSITINLNTFWIFLFDNAGVKIDYEITDSSTRYNYVYITLRRRT